MVKSVTTLGVVIAAAMTLVMSAALAAPNANEEKHTISVTPGSWEWTHETLLGPLPLNTTEIQCVKPEDATISLQEIAEELSAQCAMAEVSKKDSGYAFKLNCDGDIKGIANGKLDATDKTISLTANGAASMYGMMAPFTIKADAKYLGECQ